MILIFGLEEIGMGAFETCKSLECIIIPNTIKVIKEWEISFCSGLMTATCGNELEEMRKEAFKECISLQHIFILLAFKRIDDGAFKHCSNLMNVKFCDKIEAFVCSEVMQNGW